MHALVIEDDSLIAMFIEDELRALGFTSVDTAASEADALAAARRRTPDLITSDGRLEQGSGVAAVQSIRATGAVPVIFCTGDPEQARRSLPETIILEKPFSAAQLARAVGQATARPSSVPSTL